MPAKSPLLPPVPSTRRIYPFGCARSITRPMRISILGQLVLKLIASCAQIGTLVLNPDSARVTACIFRNPADLRRFRSHLRNGGHPFLELLAIRGTQIARLFCTFVSARLRLSPHAAG